MRAMYNPCLDQGGQDDAIKLTFQDKHSVNFMQQSNYTAVVTCNVLVPQHGVYVFMLGQLTSNF
jgi:hypothetical protein